MNIVKITFKQLFKGVATIKDDTADMLKRNSMPNKLIEVLSVLKNEHRQSHKQQNDSSGKIFEMLVDMENKTSARIRRNKIIVKGNWRKYQK